MTVFTLQLKKKLNLCTICFAHEIMKKNSLKCRIPLSESSACYLASPKDQFIAEIWILVAVWSSFIGAEFMVTFSSRSLALKSSWKSHQMTPFFVQKEVLGEKKSSFEWNMAMFSLKYLCFHLKKLTTWERVNESERKKEPQILRHSLLGSKSICGETTTLGCQIAVTFLTNVVICEFVSINLYPRKPHPH